MAWLLQSLETQVSDWRRRRQLADSDAHGQYVGRHATQLAAVTSLLQSSLDVLRNELQAIDPNGPVVDVFVHSRRVADATVWLERVWLFFAGRFDQRDASDRRAMTVQTADEVVWSCYRPAYEHPRVGALNLPPRPPPLAFVEPHYSPAARVGDRALDGGLNPSSAVPGLGPVADDLFMPLLRLPPWCVDAPWWLVFVAHEVGHHLQDELHLVGSFRRAVEAEAAAVGGDSKDAERWGSWGKELFADLCSVLLMGPWALWALLEVERHPARTMVLRRSDYPSPWVRLHYMAQMLRHLGLDPHPALRGLDLQLPTDAAPQLVLDVAVADRIAAWPTRSWKGVGPLDQLLRFKAAHFTADGTVERWATRLLSDAPLQPTRHLDTARHLIAGSLAAWARLGRTTEGDALHAASQHLAQRTSEAVLAAAPPGTRSAFMPDADERQTGEQLAQRLLQLSEPQLSEPQLSEPQPDDGEAPEG